jgi:hypothetical protein
MQTALAILCVGFAVLYLARAAARTLRGSCGGCGTSKPAPGRPDVVELTVRKPANGVSR